jgi:hypothetical protein
MRYAPQLISDPEPKMAALQAAAAVPMPDVPVVSVESSGVILIYGRDETAIVGEAVVRFVARHHVERPFLQRRRQPAEAWTAKPDLRLRRAGRGGEK